MWKLLVWPWTGLSLPVFPRCNESAAVSFSAIIQSLFSTILSTGLNQTLWFLLPPQLISFPFSNSKNLATLILVSRSSNILFFKARYLESVAYFHFPYLFWKCISTNFCLLKYFLIWYWDGKFCPKAPVTHNLFIFFLLHGVSLQNDCDDGQYQLSWEVKKYIKHMCRYIYLIVYDRKRYRYNKTWKGMLQFWYIQWTLNVCISVL